MATDEYEPNESIRSLDHNKSVKARNGWSVVDKRDGSCEVVIASGTLGTGNGALEVTAGTAITSGTATNVATQAVDIATGDPDDPRKDVVSVDRTGTAQVHKGVAAPQDPTTVTLENAEQPAPPSLNGVNATPLSMVTVPAGATSITSGNLADKRERADREFGHVRSQSSTTDQIDTPVKTVYGYPYADPDTLMSRRVSDFANAGAAANDIISSFDGFGGRVELPAGSLDGNISTSKDNVTVAGKGAKTTRLFGSVTFTDAENPRVEDFQVEGNGVTMDAEAAGGASHAFIKNVVSVGSGASSFEMNNYYGATIIAPRAINPTDHGLLLRNTNSLTVIGGVYDRGTFGIRMERNSVGQGDSSTKSARFIGGLVIQNDYHGIDVHGVRKASFYGTRFERNNTTDAAGRDDIILRSDSAGNPSQNCLLDSCEFETGGGTYSVTKGVNATADSESITVRDCHFHGINSAYPTAIRDRGSAKLSGNTFEGVTTEYDLATTTRREGAYVVQDLTSSGLTGEYVGQEAYHNGTDGTNVNAEGPAFWNGSDWVSQVDGGTIG